MSYVTVSEGHEHPLVISLKWSQKVFSTKRKQHGVSIEVKSPTPYENSMWLVASGWHINSTSCVEKIMLPIKTW
jgi:hypothetical protein